MREDVKVPPRFNPDMGAGDGCSNADRADRAHRGLVAYGIEEGSETTLAYLLGDMLHLCDREDWDFEEAMARARKYHAEER